MGVGHKKQLIAQLLSGQQADGGFGVGTYSKWTGAHWRLISLVELGVPPTNRAARKAVQTELDWIAGPSEPIVIRGLERRHASMEGNALAVACRLGYAKDRRVRAVVDVLLGSQWPDGGWNCDRHTDAHRSSFHESLAPIWGLAEYHRATGDSAALASAQRAGELLLEHRLFRSVKTGAVIHPEWMHIHWPHYWHYDFFHGLRAIEMLGWINDERASDALDHLESLRREDGTWRAGGHRYWRRSSEVVNWGDASELVTGAAVSILATGGDGAAARRRHRLKRQ